MDLSGAVKNLESLGFEKYASHTLYYSKYKLYASFKQYVNIETWESDVTILEILDTSDEQSYETFSFELDVFGWKNLLSFLETVTGENK